MLKSGYCSPSRHPPRSGIVFRQELQRIAGNVCIADVVYAGRDLVS